MRQKAGSRYLMLKGRIILESILILYLTWVFVLSKSSFDFFTFKVFFF